MDSVGNYREKSKVNLANIILALDSNIEYLDNSLWVSLKDNNLVNDIVSIYYDKYFLSTDNDYSKINEYINFNSKINSRLKTILLAIIDYYENMESTNKIKENEGSILFLTILIYLGILLYNENFNKIDDPKKIEKFINNIIDNFAKIRFKRDRNLLNLIESIKDYVVYSNKFDDLISELSTNDSYNYYIKLNSDNYYKVYYEYKIKELLDYNKRDIDIVSEKLKVYNEFDKISFDLCYFASFRLLKEGKNKSLMFPITKDSVIQNYNYYFNERDKNVLKNIKFVINYNEIVNDYNFINWINDKEIDIFIEVKNSFETNNYNLFMGIKNIIISEDFLSLNGKYKEIWKDMDLKFIIKNLEKKFKINELIKER